MCARPRLDHSHDRVLLQVDSIACCYRSIRSRPRPPGRGSLSRAPQALRRQGSRPGARRSSAYAAEESGAGHPSPHADPALPGGGPVRDQSVVGRFDGPPNGPSACSGRAGVSRPVSGPRARSRGICAVAYKSYCRRHRAGAPATAWSDKKEVSPAIDSNPDCSSCQVPGVGVCASRLDAAVRAAGHVPNSRVTTLAAGQSPSASRSSVSPPRRRACVRDQSYDECRLPRVRPKVPRVQSACIFEEPVGELARALGGVEIPAGCGYDRAHHQELDLVGHRLLIPEGGP